MKPPDETRLCIGAERDERGAVWCTWLRPMPEDAAGIEIEVEAPGGRTRTQVPEGAVRAVVARYGKELAEEVTIAPDAPALRCPGAGVLRPLRFRPYGWALPLDYLVLAREGAAPLCVPAPLFRAALLHLCRAAPGP